MQCRNPVLSDLPRDRFVAAAAKQLDVERSPE
jgi:hypothetical protein